MELQFDKSTCKSLHKVLDHVLNQELTQEIRLPESLPDIGKVLGSWGQVILRSKEWYTGSMGVSGGVMVWTLYASEDGAVVKSVESWIPFQMKWDIPDSQRDGISCVIPLLKAVDARTVSARKIMIRADVSIQGYGYEIGETLLYQATQIPCDIQMLQQTYQMEIPLEAGEKPFQIEEMLQTSNDLPTIENICYYDVKPQVTESRILGDKLLFRGKTDVHIVYFDADGQLMCFDQEWPFSQYTHLDNEFSPNANAWTYPIVTGIELDLTGEQMLAKVSVSVQYIIYDRRHVEIAEDAYSTTRIVVPQIQKMQMLTKLDSFEKTIDINQKLPIQAKDVLDIACYPSHAEMVQGGDRLEVEQAVVVQLLYLDMDGMVQCALSSGKQLWECNSDINNSTSVEILGIAKPQFHNNGEEVTVTTTMQLQACVSSENGLSMVTSLEAKEAKELDPARPSLIVRKLGSCRVWDIAKQYGARVSDIKAVNGYDEVPDSNQVLLIPLN